MKLWAALAVSASLCHLHLVLRLHLHYSTLHAIDALLSMSLPPFSSPFSNSAPQDVAAHAPAIPCPRVSRRGDENANKGEDTQRLKAPHLDPLAEAVPDPRCGDTAPPEASKLARRKRGHGLEEKGWGCRESRHRRREGRQAAAGATAAPTHAAVPEEEKAEV
uniref:Uncharacterized protein n=1 Tax=Oryza meridionalis TaxID=40149 RepID=A0A0E0C5D8_9ORYZ